MKHGKKFNHLGRKVSHRKALIKNLSKSLIINKRIFTTLAKAKVLKKFIDPIIYKSKTDTIHSRRTIFSKFQDKIVVKELFNNISEKILNRNSGYTRIIKINNRLGDNSKMCLIELVDYNEIFIKNKKDKKTQRRKK